jgi:hypothetical protein
MQKSGGGGGDRSPASTALYLHMSLIVGKNRAPTELFKALSHTVVSKWENNKKYFYNGP